jgi:hypothetical protein
VAERVLLALGDVVEEVTAQLRDVLDALAAAAAVRSGRR